MVNFINHVGFCEMKHLQQRFALKKQRSYQLLKRLIEMELVKHERIFYGRHGIVRVTSKGAGYSLLPPLDKVPIGNYDHQLKIIEVFLKLQQHYPDANWISERQLQQTKFFDGVGKVGHLADGILVLANQDQIAIEVELSLKGKDRLEKILKSYAKTDMKAVWYFCDPSILSAMRTATARFSYINIQDIEVFLNER